METFQDKEALRNKLHAKENHHVLIGYFNVEDYEGMVLSIAIDWSRKHRHYELDLQWSASGLDLFGDTLQECYVYSFSSLDDLLDYLKRKYEISIQDIPVQYAYQSERFPSPLNSDGKKEAFEAAWARFQQDFNAGRLRDFEPALVFDSARDLPA